MRRCCSRCCLAQLRTQTLVFTLITLTLAQPYTFLTPRKFGHATPLLKRWTAHVHAACTMTVTLNC